jgi:nucleoside-diphosphate-sugar epimerase
VQVGDGTNLVDTTYVENAATAHLQVADVLLERGRRAAGKAYFISQGEPVNCWGWIAELLARYGLALPRRTISLPSAWAFGAATELVYRVAGVMREPPMTRFLAAQLGTSHYFNIARARADFSYYPQITTREGMRRLARARVAE